MDAGICIPCLQSLKWYANIASICEATEEKIIRFCEQENTNRRGLVELGLNLSCKDNVEYANVFNPIETKKEAPDCKEIHVEDEETTQKAKHQFCAKHESRNKNLQQNLTDSAICDNLFKFYRCEICNFKTKYKDHHLLLHKNNKDVLESDRPVHKKAPGVKTYKCETCSFTTKNSNSLRNHQLVHLEESYECKLCNFKTRYKRSIACHQLIHENVVDLMIYKCDTCTFTTKHKQFFQTHLLTHKHNSNPTFQCILCEFKSRNKKAVVTHQVVHMETPQNRLEVKIFKCDHCAYVGRYKRNLIRHLLIHRVDSEVKMYKCELCEFQSKFKFSITRHSVIHKL